MAAAWISTHESQFQKREAVTFAITKASDQVLIGAISLMGISLRHQAELGYWIGKPYWGFGYCTEAARALLNFAFETLDLERVHCSHFSRNPASGAVMKKLGMNHEGTRIKHLSKWGILEDQEIYGVVKADWKFQKMK